MCHEPRDASDEEKNWRQRNRGAIEKKAVRGRSTDACFSGRDSRTVVRPSFPRTRKHAPIDRTICRLIWRSKAKSQPALHEDRLARLGSWRVRAVCISALDRATRWGRRRRRSPSRRRSARRAGAPPAAGGSRAAARSGTASGAPSQSSPPVEICARARSSNETREHFLSFSLEPAFVNARAPAALGHAQRR